MWDDMIWKCGNRDDPKRPDDCGCGEACPRVESLTPEEFDSVARAFLARLSNDIARAACNDVFLEEFPQSICDRFNNAGAVLAAFEQALAAGSTARATHRRDAMFLEGPVSAASIIEEFERCFPPEPNYTKDPEDER